MFPSSRFRQFCSTRPVTVLLVVVVVALQACVRLSTTADRDPASAYREFGVLQVQQSPEHPKLFGPFDLWSGEWWRIPWGGLHHAGWWHLGFVVFAILYLGGLLERKIHVATYLCFLLGALLVTTIPRWLTGDLLPAWFIGQEPWTGSSGIAFALYGALLLLRRNDRQLAQSFGEGGILLGMVAGLGFMAVSTIPFHTMNVDNLAHLAGLPYGMLWGLVLPATQWVKRGLLVALIAGHALLWPVIEGLTQPLENARYHWWQAEQTDDLDSKRLHYQTALKFDPELESPWLALAELEFQNQQPHEAWQTLVKGLQQHPRLENSEQLSRRIWAAFSTAEERRKAWREAERKVSHDSVDWSQGLLSPRQSAAFHLENRQPLEAWFSLMRHLRELPPPTNPTTAQPQFAEQEELAKNIWGTLDTKGERMAALQILDEQLELNRRAWHLALISPRDLMLHYQNQGELLWAWQLVMEELRADPTFHQEGKQIAHEIWRTFPTKLRRQRARHILHQVFGLESLAWQIELGILSDAVRNRYRLDQAVSLPADALDEGMLEPRGPLSPINPDAPSSALLGNPL